MIGFCRSNCLGSTVYPAFFFADLRYDNVCDAKSCPRDDRLEVDQFIDHINKFENWFRKLNEQTAHQRDVETTEGNVSSCTQAFNERHQQLTILIEKKLEQYSDFGGGCPKDLKAAIRHSLLAPAKRLRPTLVLLAAEACGGDVADAMPAACAVEMIHTYSLIHDDLPAMDDDDLRRGLPSCHAKFGEAVAILAGDALLAQAFEVISRDTSPSEVAVKCCVELSTTAGALHLVGGQADDLDAEQRDDLAGSDLERIHRRKTGAMIISSLRMGAFVANADAGMLEKLTIFGENIGLAFQIVDDLLDFSGDQTKIGKSLGKDSQSEKLTYVKLYGLDESKRKADKLIDDAIESLKDFGTNGHPLIGLAQFILNRTY
jgi:geranylgeranyl diphosphate synthase type II